MPLKTAGSLPAYMKKRSKKEQERWMGIWNQTFRELGSETDAYNAANKAVNLSREEMREAPVTCVLSSIFPDVDAAGVYQVQVIRSGFTLRNFQGLDYDIEIANCDLADAVRNFRSSSLKPFLDYNHAITRKDVKPGDQEAIGWMRDLWIETLDGVRLEPKEAESSKEKVLVLRAEYEITDAVAAEKIKDKKYAFYSPTWYPIYLNEETGEYQGMTVVGGAATNRPYINGMEGFVAIAQAGIGPIELATLLPHASLCVVAPVGIEAPEAVKALDSMGYKIDSMDYGTYRIRTVDEQDMVKKLEALTAAGFTVTSFYQGYIENQKRDGKETSGSEVVSGSEAAAPGIGKYPLEAERIERPTLERDLPHADN